MQRWLVHFCHVTKILIADWLLAEVTLITIDPLSWDQSNRISSWDKIQLILKSQQTNIWMRVCWDIILFHGSRKSGFLKRFIRCVNTKRRAHVLRAIWTPFSSFFTRATAREITYNNFEISLVVFMPNITTNHAVTYTNTMIFPPFPSNIVSLFGGKGK